MNQAVATTQPTSLEESGQALMEKMVLRAKHAVKDAFLDSLSDAQYAEFVQRSMDEFLFGPPAKRFKWVRQDRRQYIRSVDELGETRRLAAFDGPWAGPKEYFVEERTINDEYIVANDPESFPGMLRKMLKDKVKKEYVEELLRSPEMATRYVNADGYNGYQLFETLVSGFMRDNMHLIVRAEREAMINSVFQGVISAMRNNGNGRGY